MKCINCNNAGKCLDHKEQPSLIGCTSGIPQRKKQTNADRIHSMNIEETAELLYSFHNLEYKVKFCKNKTECDEILDSGKEIPDDMCKKCLVEWLQSEVEE